MNAIPHATVTTPGGEELVLVPRAVFEAMQERLDGAVHAQSMAAVARGEQELLTPRGGPRRARRPDAARLLARKARPDAEGPRRAGRHRPELPVGARSRPEEGRPRPLPPPRPGAARAHGRPGAGELRRGKHGGKWPGNSWADSRDYFRHRRDFCGCLCWLAGARGEAIGPCRARPGATCANAGRCGHRASPRE